MPRIYSETALVSFVDDVIAAVRELEDANEQHLDVLYARVERLLEDAEKAIERHDSSLESHDSSVLIDLKFRMKKIHGELEEIMSKRRERILRNCRGESHHESPHGVQSGLPLLNPRQGKCKEDQSGKYQREIGEGSGQMMCRSAKEEDADEQLEVVGDIDDMDLKFHSLSIGKFDGNKSSPSKAPKNNIDEILPRGLECGNVLPSYPERRIYKLVRNGERGHKIKRKEEKVMKAVGQDSTYRMKERFVQESHDAVGHRCGQSVGRCSNKEEVRSATVPTQGNKNFDEDEETRRYKQHTREHLRVELPNLPAEVMAAAADRSTNSRDSGDSTIARRKGSESDSDESITSPDVGTHR